ncbi:hypothetical protein DBR11_09550 [Pedobacter sp. HMWF019]|uniref:hypothetical protein n=1 Tax=Pedobacter sp. HMWF019 TaxID=2056856 RepID=UPI000D37DE33|nr:hypothetical protein [Pedobacter sp. HMWF019]PTT00611.1 hypothetical protein DBR11_09550 [Pedobacter sp. HMWF019]
MNNLQQKINWRILPHIMLAILLFFGLLNSFGIAASRTSGFETKAITEQPVHIESFKKAQIYYKSFLHRRVLIRLAYKILNISQLILSFIYSIEIHIKLLLMAILMLLIASIEMKFLKKAFLMFGRRRQFFNLA